MEIELRMKALEMAVEWHKHNVPPSNNYTPEQLLDIANKFVVFLKSEKEKNENKVPSPPLSNKK